MLIRNAHEGYVSWEQFEQIQQAIASNDRGWEQSGAVQNGPALLAGLLRCRRCGRKLTVRYSGNQGDCCAMPVIAVGSSRGRGAASRSVERW